MSDRDLINLRNLAEKWSQHDSIVAFALDGAADEIDRLRALNDEIREALADIIVGAQRDRSLLVTRLGPLHPIQTTVTKGQVLRAIRHVVASDEYAASDSKEPK